MWSEQGSPTFLFVIAASIVAHVVTLAALPAADAASPAAPPAATMFTVDSLPPPPPPPPPPPAAPPQDEPVTVSEDVVARVPAQRSPRPTAPRREAPTREVAAAEPVPGPEAPMDFSGVTLSNESSSWSSPTGNGEPQRGPTTTPSSGTRPGRANRAPTSGSSDRVVAVGDLSRRPKAPDLDRALEANYPSDARRAGTTGKAVVRARILRDGSVGKIRVVSESAAGFGAACKRTLTGSHWQPPLDASKEAVATDVNYTCTFAVAR